MPKRAPSRRWRCCELAARGHRQSAGRMPAHGAEAALVCRELEAAPGPEVA